MPDQQTNTPTVPLCVDLDGTFIRGDMMWDAILRLIRSKPARLLHIPWWLLSGRHILKSRLTQHAPPPVLAPPLNQRLLTFLYEEKSKGRKIVLATAAHRSFLGPILQTFPFDDVLASDDTINLKGSAKAKALVERYGNKGFDYAGDSTADEAVWQVARKAIVVQRSKRLVKRWSSMFDVERVIPTGGRTTWKDWVRALRIHQWSKNLLIAVPFLVGHHFNEPWQLAGLTAAFLAISLCASGTYIWNDLLDMDHDRSHATKKDRMAASGRTSVHRLISVSLLLVAAGLGGAFYLKWQFGLLLFGYIITTLAYSLVLKRIAIADIFVLALLYLSRIVAGIVISLAVVSFWLFAFTFLFFLSLAAMKRFVELRRTTATGNESLLPGRGYHQEDLPMVSEFGISTGIASIVVLGLYSNSTQVTALYHHPEWFWGVCVAALYWITRVWFLTKRGIMHDDPVVFAIKDRSTWLIAAFALACVLLASPIPSP
ncbi:MAG: UbiA family prenyltransferase [Verrucomicrobiota bacterium]